MDTAFFQESLICFDKETRLWVCNVVMETVLRKIVATLVKGLAYIPMGLASLSFIFTFLILVKSLVLWVKKGSLSIPALHDTVGLGFLHYLMDDRLTGVRRYLIQGAAKTANLPAPVVFLCFGVLCLLVGLSILHFARAIRNA